MKPLLEIIRAREAELRLLRSEGGVAFASNGDIVLEKRSQPGREFELEFSDDEIALLRDVGDVTFTHSHPRGWQYPPTDPRHAGASFSPDDLLLACRAELAEIRAVTPVWTFSMAPPPERPWTEGTWQSEILPLHRSVRMQIREQLYAAALRGEISPQEAATRLDHEVWIEVARLLGLRYNRFEE